MFRSIFFFFFSFFFLSNVSKHIRFLRNPCFYEKSREKRVKNDRSKYFLITPTPMEGVVASWGQLNREKSLILLRFEEEEKKKRWPTHGKRITPNANMDDKLFFLFFLLLGSPIFSKGFSLKLSSEQREVRERETDSDREKEWNREKNSGWKGKKKKKKEIYVHPSFRFLFYLFLDEIVNLDLIELITANLPCISVYNLKRKISE